MGEEGGRRGKKERKETEVGITTFMENQGTLEPVDKIVLFGIAGQKDKKIRNANVYILSASSACSACVWVWDFLR